MKRITDWAHDGLQRQLSAADWALDATLGNGHDAEHLLQCVGATGRVFGFDIQACAIESTRERLGDAPALVLHQANHADMAEHLPPEAMGRLRAAVFNLGYLPGGDHKQTTHCVSTLAALGTALEWLAPGGVLCCTCYPGMASGKAEADAICAWLAECSESGGTLTRIEPQSTQRPAPFLLWFEKSTHA